MAKHAVDGVYDGDPNTDSGAELLPELTHLEAIERGLKVMDTTALSLCMDNEPADLRVRARGPQHQARDFRRAGRHNHLHPAKESPA